MVLSQQSLPLIQSKEIIKPDESVFDLPVKVLQFGTGVLLRGLPDYFIDKANRQGVFNGRVVVVKSTKQGGTDDFDKQDGLYTLIEKGIENGHQIESRVICSAISHVIPAIDQWDKVLDEVLNPGLQIIISNTTEVGIQLVEEDINQSPPASFPGKLLALLYKRFLAFEGSAASGFIIIPTELLPDNGQVLKAILLRLLRFNNLGADFENWINTANSFCSSLVDRIVPGKPANAELKTIEKQTGYEDGLLVISEVYRLWAIEGDEKIKSILSFETVDEGVIITPDINVYRELKLRLLNGTHTLSCGLAFLSGFETVKTAMDDEFFIQFVHKLMLEIGSAIPYAIDQDTITAFAEKVTDRFKNPHIRHLWISITQQYTSKLKMRVIPVLLEYYKKYKKVPAHVAVGFAAYLAFMRPVKELNGNYFGEYNEAEYSINDDKAGYFFKLWQNELVETAISMILKDETLWGTDLTTLPGFAETVKEHYNAIKKDGAAALINN